ncbi:MAG: aldolase/citrate lyase family protein, partial [Halocynthiibacter sp.]
MSKAKNQRTGFAANGVMPHCGNHVLHRKIRLANLPAIFYRLHAQKRNIISHRPAISFRIQPAAPARLNRCQLFGPGSRPAIFEKMAKSAADVINLDLEDSVAPDDKPGARRNIIDAIGDIDWGTKHLSVR